MKTELTRVFPLYPIPSVVLEGQAAVIEAHRAGQDVDSDYLSTILAFRDRRWNQIRYHALIVPLNDIVCAQASYYFLTLESFRYYFPAWVHMALDPPEDAYGLYDSLCSVLDLGDYADHNKGLFEERFAAYNQAQKAIIAKALRYIMSVAQTVLGRDPATPAYWSYWHQFDPDPLPKPE